MGFVVFSHPKDSLLSRRMAKCMICTYGKSLMMHQIKLYMLPFSISVILRSFTFSYRLNQISLNDTQQMGYVYIYFKNVINVQYVNIPLFV